MVSRIRVLDVEVSVSEFRVRDFAVQGFGFVFPVSRFHSSMFSGFHVRVQGFEFGVLGFWGFHVRGFRGFTVRCFAFGDCGVCGSMFRV